MKRFILALLACAPFAAMADDYHPVSWFAAHPAERAQTQRWCRDNPGLAGHNPNCVNADDAEQRVGYGAMSKSADAKWNAMIADSCRWTRRQHVPETPRDAHVCDVALGLVPR